MAETESARVIIEVVAGFIPGKDPDPAYTQRYPITSKQWQEAGDKGGNAQAQLLAETVGEAQGYAAMLMNSPNILNWVRTDWIWL